MLKNLFISFLRQYLFWLAFFFICRTIFLLYNAGELKGIGFGEIISTYWNALYLDTSMASYLLAFSVLIIPVYSFFPKKIIFNIHKGYVIIILAIFSLITIAELETYDEWGTKLNIKGLRFLEHPSEVVNSTSTTFLIIGFLSVGILTWLGMFLCKKIAPLRDFSSKRDFTMLQNIFSASVFILITPVLITLGIRGGWQQIPIQQSDAYFSKHNILNLASVNSGWNLGQSIWENKKNMKGNPYVYFSADEAKKNVVELFKTEKDTTISFLKTNRPNVVLVILESWSADMLKSLGGFDSAATHFDELATTGIMFDSIYSSGDLSDQGMTAIFSGFPALPAATSIIGQPGKYNHLPCLNNEFHQMGYSTSYLFGGQLSYGNIKAYMYYNNFDRILEGKDFVSDIPRGKLGVHDEFLYARQLQELKNEKEPFFAGMFTSSSHSPYDMPMDEKDKVKWGDDENEYVNSIRYADEKLFEFIQSAQKEKWFDNTLFIFVSDHSHRSPKHWAQQQPEYRKIAMMFWGNVIKDEFKGYRYKKICSQLDMASTLLNQLGVSSEKYQWSKNLFNPQAPEFAFYETYDGFGFVRPNQYIVYSHLLNQYYYEKTISPEEKSRLTKEGKSFLQVMFQEYTDY
ncbi:MAG: sulfatase-like hydrolase/transferase [Bacteroidetes bacterium]|nr:sulfatase-like hydrolase/transferase [Bacteroidota bacterium]